MSLTFQSLDPKLDPQAVDNFHDWQYIKLGCARCGNRWSGLYSLTYKQAFPLGYQVTCPNCNSRLGVHPVA